MKSGNFAISLSIISAVVLFVALLFYSGKSNMGIMRTQIGTDISAVSAPEPVNSLAVNKIRPTVNSIAVNRVQPTVNSFAKVVPTVNSIVVNRIRPTVNSAESLLSYAY